ncbi:HdeD family acid-resistance protein [Flammeovirga agarivorans]|uniref:HdeD family acid-resistance protein n=1 Tax=Flammeovirga agarivorans TaxID=2726742 RepID=A0A7X8XX97_9BACT|nr:DUF308 domain-containing protein [Flammeovirga agarivorans]NLR93034.1 HdeD family acid-resistance protein [Flammeovirga agarivorans]
MKVSKSLKHWYLFLLSGILLVGTGIITFFYPLESYLVLSVFFSITFILTGMSDIIFSIINRNVLRGWGWSLFWGIINTLLGVFLIQNPSISVATLPMYVGFTFLVRSIGVLSYSELLKSFGIIASDPLTILGVIGLILSLVLIWNPILAGLTIVTLMGVIFIVTGVFQISLSFRLKKAKEVIQNKVDLELV